MVALPGEIRFPVGDRMDGDRKGDRKGDRRGDFICGLSFVPDIAEICETSNTKIRLKIISVTLRTDLS